MRDYQALVGDAIDNVPKVPGIGPKTAADLLSEVRRPWSTLLAHLDEVKKPKMREALESNREQLERAKKLVTFKTDLPLDVTARGASRRREIERAEAQALFTELEFYRLHRTRCPAGTAPPPLRPAGDAGARRGGPREALAKQLDAADPGGGWRPTTRASRTRALLLGLGLRPSRARRVPRRGAPCGGVGDAAGAGARARGAGASVAHDAQGALARALRGAGHRRRAAGGHRRGAALATCSTRRARSTRLADLARERLRRSCPPAGAAKGGRRAPMERRPGFGAAAEAIARLAPELWTEADGRGPGRAGAGHWSCR